MDSSGYNPATDTEASTLSRRWTSTSTFSYGKLESVCHRLPCQRTSQDTDEECSVRAIVVLSRCGCMIHASTPLTGTNSSRFQKPTGVSASQQAHVRLLMLGATQHTGCAADSTALLLGKISLRSGNTGSLAT